MSAPSWHEFLQDFVIGEQNSVTNDLSKGKIYIKTNLNIYANKIISIYVMLLYFNWRKFPLNTVRVSLSACKQIMKSLI